MVQIVPVDSGGETPLAPIPPGGPNSGFTTAFDEESFHQASIVAYKTGSEVLMTLLLQRSDFEAPLPTLRRALHWALEVSYYAFGICLFCCLPRSSH